MEHLSEHQWEIVDDAIHKSEKGGLRKAFSIITSRRYDDEDYVASKETVQDTVNQSIEIIDKSIATYNQK